ncbi:MAG TPA: recombinase family protein [Candidatus Saccharimonadales bacterium]|nr:recombinase family protein [Candidatus Saccharimonadales bacterium]
MLEQTESKTTLEQFTVVERAIIYARVSTDEQAESGTSIDNQVDKSLAYAAANNLYVPPEFIFKEDYSGKPLDRPELNKVRDMLRAGMADNLIVYKTNRLDRSEWGLNLLILLQEFKQLGVSLHYSQDRRRIDLTNPIEALMQSISGWQAGEDHRETVSKLHEGRIRRASDGYVVPHGASPYGYRPVKIDKRWYLEIVEAEAAIVRQIFQWYVFGDETGKPLSMLVIAEYLNQTGIVTRNGKKWVRSTVGAILENETYAGTWHYRKEAARKDASVEAIPVEVPAIVDRQAWELAKEQLKHNKDYSQRNRKPGRYLLATRVTCGDCTYKMFGCAKDNKYFYYVCRNVGLSKEKACECHNPRYIVGVVDSKVWDRLEEVSRDKDQLIDGLRGYQAQQESKVEQIKRELAYVEQLIIEKNAEWESAYLDQKLLTSERAKARKAVEIAQTEQVIKELEKRQSDLLAQFEGKSLTNEQIIGLVTFASQVADDMATLREAEAKGKDMPELKAAVYEAKRRLLALLDVQVTLFVRDGKKKARIVAKYCPDGEELSVELGNICTPYLNRQKSLIFECEIDLD